ncbi:aspartic proteinase 36-like [Nymphaea colorata]|nr:aspartic proteinase 36-like [Nymphaea colorata]
MALITRLWALLCVGLLCDLCFCRELYRGSEVGGGGRVGLHLNQGVLGGRGSPMILPLVLTPANLSWQFIREEHRRKAQATDSHQISNAHMKLYDDLLLNGYYTTRLFIGTPPQEFALIVDSGSTVTYVPCDTCEQCGNHQDPKFQTSQSSTYEPVKCNIDCTCDKDNAQCTYERQYAEMSSSSGVLGKDIVSFGNESSLKPQHLVFGCENSETGDLYSQRADGIMGLGRGQLSIMDQLVEEGVISDSFSLCYGGMEVGGGAMVLGGISPPPGMVFSPSDPGRSPYYNIELREMHVAGKKLQLNPSIFNGKHGTVLDSGTTYAYLPEAAFVAFRDAIFKSLQSLKRIPGPDPSYHDICFAGAGSDISRLSETFPTVDMVFSNGQKLSLSPENYLFRHSKVHGAYCLGVFQNGRDPTTLLGGIIVRNTLVTYDRANEKIGFWKTNCSELWDRLQLNEAPPSAEPPAPEKNSTMPSLPSMPPSQPPMSSASGSTQRVGFIRFVLHLTIKLSDLIPHIHELEESIVHELEVNSYQVRIVNFTGDVSGSVVSCSVYPDGSTGYISNATVERIHTLVAEHRMNLPSTFGSYRLLGWEIDQPSERTWLQRHMLVVIAATMLVVMLISSAFIGWYVWRRHSQAALGAYKPVDAVVPEQELQPL